MNDEIKKMARDLTQDLNEMMKSTSAVKGKAFANVVAHQFEALELSDLVGVMLSSLIHLDPKNTDKYRSMTETVIMIISSMTAKVAGELPEPELDEALKMSDSMHARRRNAVMAAMKTDLGGK